PYHSTAEKFAFSTGLGLGVIAHLVFALGLLHLLTRAATLGLFGTVAVFLAPSWRDLSRDAAHWWQSTPASRRTLYCVVVLLLIPVLLLPLYPPTQADAVGYHLPEAKIYATSHAVVFTPYLRYPAFPQLNEMLFTLMLLWHDDVSAQLVQF